MQTTMDKRELESRRESERERSRVSEIETRLEFDVG